jgi:hypothetical protein
MKLSVGRITDLGDRTADSVDRMEVFEQGNDNSVFPDIGLYIFNYLIKVMKFRGDDNEVRRFFITEAEIELLSVYSVRPFFR